VFILNFFADSPCKEEWRVLLQYLAEVEERGGKGGEQALPFRKPLAAITPADLGFSSVRLNALVRVGGHHRQLALAWFGVAGRVSCSKWLVWGWAGCVV
jgi:hypothetical protein